MKANRAYELIVSRGGLEPAFLATDGRLDRIEIVSVDDGEVVLFWDVPAKVASKLLRELRYDIATLDEHQFIDKWTGADAEDLF